MKAWTFTHGGYPQALHQTELPADEAPLKSTEVRVRTKAASLNPIDGQLMGFPLLGSLPGWMLLAHKGVSEDFAGVVEEAGARSGFRAGDDVFGIVYFLPTGSLRETIRVDTRTRSPGRAVVLPKPAGRLDLGGGDRAAARLADGEHLHYRRGALHEGQGRQLRLRHVRELTDQAARLARRRVVLGPQGRPGAQHGRRRGRGHRV
ncbi:hypothetical protein PG988_011009 [Apiospora saccharicola]